jgi:hypothetical protein
MFELHVLVAVIVMLNILELIMEIVPNYPTHVYVYCTKNSDSLFYFILFQIFLLKQNHMSSGAEYHAP